MQPNKTLVQITYCNLRNYFNNQSTPLKQSQQKLDDKVDKCRMYSRYGIFVISRLHRDCYFSGSL